MLKTHKSLETVNSASTDGAANMTGIDNGAVRLLELSLERPLQRIVCILHGVELALRKIFEAIGNEWIMLVWKLKKNYAMNLRTSHVIEIQSKK